MKKVKRYTAYSIIATLMICGIGVMLREAIVNDSGAAIATLLLVVVGAMSRLLAWLLEID